jgi:valyl-tRNA synthetase
VAFERLYRDGLAYRTEALDQLVPGLPDERERPRGRADPETGTPVVVRYHLIDEATGAARPDATITVATTRPETILGDTAVAVHPDDARYRASSGGGRASRSSSADVPIIADDVVDREFGTGRREDHPGPRPRRLRDRQAPRPRADDPRRRRDDRDTARRSTGSTATRPASGSWRDLDARGDLEGERPHEMVIGRCQRSNDVIEPRLKTQWFIRTSRSAARRWPRRAPAGRGSCPSASRRPGSTG